MLREGLVPAFREVFGDVLVSLVLFGSYARCSPGPSSDIDLIVVLEELPSDRVELHRSLDRVEELLEAGLYPRLRGLGLGPVLSPIVYDRALASGFRPLYIDAVFDAVVLYDKDGFMEGVLRRVRGWLAERGARRVRIGAGWVVDFWPRD